MKYHIKEPTRYTTNYGRIYICNHPVYSRCTLFKVEDDRGLAVIQQRYDASSKVTYWTEIDPWICDKLYLHKKFYSVFKSWAKKPDENGLYPTVTVRQIMWELRLKPLKRECWETYFDKKGF